MYNKSVKVLNKTGLHARPASLFVKSAAKFESTISIKLGKKVLNGKSIMGLLSANIGNESEMELIAEGPDEREAIETLSKLFEDKFGEEE